VRAAAALLLALVAAPAAAQTNDHIFRSLRWWSDPLSARAAGLGGAVVALADDTGAARANPANLTSLTRTEVAASLRRTSAGASDPAAGSIASDPLEANTALGLLAGAGRIGTRWAVMASLAGTRQVGLRLDPRVLPDGLTDEGTLDLKVTAGGLAGAWQIGRSIHVGAHVDAARASISGEYRRESPGRAAELRVGVGGADTRVTGGLGAVWEPAAAVRLGVAAVSGASWSLDRTAVSPALDVTFDPGSTFRVRQPAVVSLGTCLRVSRQVTAVAQLDRVRYGEIQDALSIRLGAHARADYHLDDAWEPRAGLELSLPFRSASLQLRGGYWHAAGGSVRYVGSDPVESASFLGTAPEDVLSAGASLATRGFRLDVAGAHSGPGNQFLVGVTGRF
jgi:long-subunit fatty acid transport protein